MILIDIDQQVLIHHQHTFKISSAKLGPGSEKNSFKTPLGLHAVCDIIGIHEPIYTQFVARKPIGLYPPSQWSNASSIDMILSRIIRLKGLEPGINQGPGVDSYERLIYIHGTHQETLIGTPQSKGCIRMLNHDIIKLCQQIHIGEQINIKERL
jgi:hypothetical protein